MGINLFYSFFNFNLNKTSMSFKKNLLSTIIFVSFFTNISAQDFTLKSPDGKINLDVEIGKEIKWQASYEQDLTIAPSSVSLIVDNQVLGGNPILQSDSKAEIRQIINPVAPLKSKIVQDNYNELLLVFKDNYAISFRAYNDGVAYRFKTFFKKEIIVNDENLRLNFPTDNQIFFPEEKSYVSDFQPNYLNTKLTSISKEKFCSLPTLLKTKIGINVLVTEADLYDYPNMFMYATGQDALTANFPKVVLETKPGAKRPIKDEKITKTADYIAKTNGERSFPWRVFTITREDAKLVESNLVYKLSRSLKLPETDWIKPGKVAWDWWNANNIYGVDFRAGLNTDTYKYYIDFAAKYGLEYIILDEGWSRSNTNLMESNPDLDVKELVNYGEKKGVGLILWTLWKPLDQDMDLLLDKFSEWGVKGIKVDFMRRADQYMVNFYERVARKSAKRKLLVDLHGSFKPAGLRRAYPNFLTSEGVDGLEVNKWGEDITPEHNLILPFTRMVAGPMDYTPGAMTNANKESFRHIFDSPMSMGTRCHQLAMYVVYESGLQMLADNPSNYYKEPKSVEFISKIPVVWDETKVLDAKVSNYILIARKKNEKWYVGAMTDWEPRNLKIDFAFLDKGNYRITIMKDGINADRNGMDFKKITKEITKESELNIEMAPGGGWAAIIEKIE